MNGPLAPPNAPILDTGRFDPDRAETSWTLPADWYFEPEIYRQEHEAIFYRTWQFVCHGERLRDSGQYVAFEIQGQSLFAVRDRNGTLRAFYNVCRHRAHELLKGEGQVRMITSPTRPMAWLSEAMIENAPMSCRMSSAAMVSRRMRLSAKATSSGMRLSR